jgi:hypothetical protein
VISTERPPKAIEAVAGVVDATTGIHGGASSIPALMSIPAVATALSAAAVVGGVLALPIGASLYVRSYKGLKVALACKDQEGILKNLNLGFIATGYTGALTSLAVEGGLSLAGVAVPTALSLAIGGLGLSMYGAILLHAGVGLKRVVDFSSELKKKMGEGEKSTIEWLGEQILPQKGETAQETQKKWSALERRTDGETCRLLQEELPKLLKEFDLEKAKNVIEQVEKANFKQKIRYALLICIGIIGIAGFIVAFALSGPISSALIAIGALAWLMADSSRVYNFIGEKCWVWHRGKKSRPLA